MVLKKYKIDGFNITQNKKMLGNISNVFTKKYKLTESQQQELISKIVSKLLKLSFIYFLDQLYVLNCV